MPTKTFARRWGNSECCGMDNEAISKSLENDAILEKEWQDLRDELPTLTHREMIRKVEITKRMEAIGKERFELFKERREVYNKIEDEK